jgi:hypothetical protein
VAGSMAEPPDQSLFETEPPDDAGSGAQVNFKWQLSVNSTKTMWLSDETRLRS